MAASEDIAALRERVRSRPLPRHVAVIMDGNGRWAERRGLPRAEGHRAGAGAVRTVTEEARRVGAAIERLQIDTRAMGEVRRLSGGNQQKVTIARWIARGVETLLLFDPTRGIDIRTKRQIYALVRDLALPRRLVAPPEPASAPL